MIQVNFMIYPVILCGGSGTRLWPLSRKAFPKQFTPLLGEKSLLQLTLERVANFVEKDALICCVAAEEHRFLVADVAEQAGMSVRQILEPEAKNTAAAMALGALSVPGETMLLFCPADHYIPDAQALVDLVKSAVPAARAGRLVTFGITPTHPSTAYGYIKKGGAADCGGFEVAKFVEKPQQDKAVEFLANGQYLWNAGIFLVEARILLDALEAHAPDILEVCRKSMEKQQKDGLFIRPDGQIFAGCRNESIDYAVMERCSNVTVFPFDGVWSDVGSWESVASLSSKDEKENRIQGDGLVVQGERTYIYASHRAVVALGTRDLMIIETPDAMLVMASGYAEKVKDVVAQLEARRSPQAAMHRKVARPWGSYDSIDNGERFQVKRIVVKPGASLSLQRHYHRAEHWIVVNGTAEVTCGDKTLLLTENQSTYIPLGEIHRLANPGTIPLEIIEVQSGSYLGEDDIVRLDDVYGRLESGSK
ncbi:mannose-1-phosphate guanylyltransferase/mannose-6-phosphate isomerase [Cupriavidus pinatubonensis]|uniref:mannose-1-phosphate guanylyltransferase/mannose-6-phosphate isomerase n=1 Tax=Cupriavidus pinatubonensis TaxID=248026 RepID=UPI002159E0B2|nr:mannose-1-phosphate guanylyltransferase/mannose-6-phosphate isomerase [Cupriavidus pinatubonensis]